jgi:hypothetical protein
MNTAERLTTINLQRGMTMATTDDTSKVRRARNPAATATTAKTRYSDSRLMEVIEEERTRLMQAESLLQCILIAMEDAEGEARKLYYPNLIELIRSLVNQSIGALDSVRLRPLIEQMIEQMMKSDKPYSIPENKLSLGLGDDSVKDGGNVLYLS